MAFNIVQVVPTVSNNGSGATTFPVTINGVTPGNSLLIFAASYEPGGSQLVTASGFVAASFPSSDGATSGNILVQAVAVGGNTTITLNVSADSYTRVTILEVSGLDSAPLDLSFGTSGSAATLTATATSATANANEVVFGMLWLGSGANWPAQGSYTIAYIDNTSGPASQAFYGNLTTVQPALSVTANNNTGSTVGFLCVTLKLAGGPLSVSSITKSKTSLIGLNSIRSSVTSTSRFAASLDADIIRAGSFTGTIHGKSHITAKLAQAFVSSTSGWSSALYGFALGNSPNTVNILQVASLVNTGSGWNAASASIGCNSGDTLVVLTANNNKNLSGTYKPTVNQGVLQLIVDQQTLALGSTYPLYAQAYIMPYIKAGTYVFTPPNEGTGGSGTMTVVRLSGILGLRNGSVQSVLNNTGTYSLVTTNSSANAGDFLLSIATTLGQVITPPISCISASRSVINNGASSSVDSRTVQRTKVHQSTWNWGSATPAAAAVTFALVPTINPNATGTIFGYTKQTGTVIRANPLIGKIRAAVNITAVSAFQLPFSSVVKTRSKMTAAPQWPMFSTARLPSTRILRTTAVYPAYNQAQILGIGSLTADAVNPQTAKSAGRSTLTGSVVKYLYKTSTISSSTSITLQKPLLGVRAIINSGTSVTGGFQYCVHGAVFGNSLLTASQKFLLFSRIQSTTRVLGATANQFSAKSAGAVSAVVNFGYSVKSLSATAINMQSSARQVLFAKTVSAGRFTLAGSVVKYLYKTSTISSSTSITLQRPILGVQASIKSGTSVTGGFQYCVHGAVFGNSLLTASQKFLLFSRIQSTTRVLGATANQFSAKSAGALNTTVKFGYSVKSLSITAINVQSSARQSLFAKTVSTKRVFSSYGIKLSAESRSNTAFSADYVYQSVKTYIISSRKTTAAAVYGFSAVLPSRIVLKPTINFGWSSIIRTTTKLSVFTLQELLVHGVLKTNYAVRSVQANSYYAVLASIAPMHATTNSFVKYTAQIHGYSAAFAHTMVNVRVFSRMQTQSWQKAEQTNLYTAKIVGDSRSSAWIIKQVRLQGKTVGAYTVKGGVILFNDVNCRISATLAMYAQASSTVWAIAEVLSSVAVVSTISMYQALTAAMRKKSSIFANLSTAVTGTISGKTSVFGNPINTNNSVITSAATMTANQTSKVAQIATLTSNTWLGRDITIPRAVTSKIVGSGKTIGTTSNIVPWVDLVVEEDYYIEIEPMVV